jgi:signal transduction histidine kinase
VKLRLRTKFLLSMLLVSAGLTCTSLLLVRKSVQTQVRREIYSDLQNSVSTFNNFQRERAQTLSRSADLLADLPNLRALMTTQDAATIQDGSEPLWRLAGGDLFALAGRTGTVVALHTNTPGFTRQMAQQSLAASLSDQGSGTWWFGAQHLYQVFVKPIYFGPPSEDRILGFLVIGYEIDDSVASQLSRVAASQVVFYYGDHLVRSTLAPDQEAQLSSAEIARQINNHSGPQEVQLGGEHFLCTSLELDAPDSNPVRLTVLKSYDRAVVFLDDLNRLLLALGLAAVLGGSILVFVISDRITRPLSVLVNGVHALEKGDFQYQLGPRTRDEVGELTGAFDRMRHTLMKAQQELLEAERLATIGRMASSISHDLRHSLAAILANAEFLCEPRLSPEQREELYQEVRRGVEQMTELIDSLLEFSRTRATLHPSYGSVRESVDRVIQTVRSHPEFQHVNISVDEHGASTGWFDPRRLERALFNLVLNACEAVSGEEGAVKIQLRETSQGIEIMVADNGRGIPEIIRHEIFEPFVSSGKENGTGLGLTVVQKIVQDHGGDVTVERTSAEGTVFKLTIPFKPPRDDHEQPEAWRSTTFSNQ